MVKKLSAIVVSLTVGILGMFASITPAFAGSSVYSTPDTCAYLVSKDQIFGSPNTNFTVSFNVTSCSTQEETVTINWQDITGETCMYDPWTMGPLFLKPGETKGLSITLPMVCPTSHTFQGDILDQNGNYLSSGWYFYFIGVRDRRHRGFP